MIFYSFFPSLSISGAINAKPVQRLKTPIPTDILPGGFGPLRLARRVDLYNCYRDVRRYRNERADVLVLQLHHVENAVVHGREREQREEADKSSLCLR